MLYKQINEVERFLKASQKALEEFKLKEQIDDFIALEYEPAICIVGKVDEVEIFLKTTQETLEVYKNDTINDTIFRVNEYITLKLERGKTNIYVNGKRFNQCKYLLLNIPVDEIEEFDEIQSIDDASERLDRSLEGIFNKISEFNITPEQEFQAHCSNIQAWVESNYDTRLMHRNLAFPLLQKLAEIGDSLAKQLYKDEIALRLESGEETIFKYLMDGEYLKPLDNEELLLIAENMRESPAKLSLLKYLIQNGAMPEVFTRFKKLFLFDKKIFTPQTRAIQIYPLDFVIMKNTRFKGPLSIYDKISCKFLGNKMFLDFGIRSNDKKVVFPYRYIQLAKKIMNQNEDIQISFPLGNGPLKIFSKSENIQIFIEQTYFH